MISERMTEALTKLSSVFEEFNMEIGVVEGNFGSEGLDISIGGYKNKEDNYVPYEHFYFNGPAIHSEMIKSKLDK